MNVVTTIIFMTFIIMVAQRWHQYESIPSGGQEMLSGKIFRVIIISFVGVVVKSTQQGWNESIRYPYVREKRLHLIYMICMERLGMPIRYVVGELNNWCKIIIFHLIGWLFRTGKAGWYRAQ